MRKGILSVMLWCTLPISILAQVQTSSDGRVYLNSIYQVNRASVTAGNASSYNFSTDYKFGLYAYAHNNIFNIGVRGTAVGDDTSRAIGVQGVASNSTGFNCGVLGAINDLTNYGAGVFGTLSNHQAGKPIFGRYAGYFCGETKVEGTVTATSFVNTSDIRLKENVTSLTASDVSGSTLADVMSMDVIEYNFRDIEPEQSDTATCFVKREAEPDKRKHFGLSAQELQKIYPNLVVEGQDGYLAVNYIELVPVLIRSVQELKQELDEAKGLSSRTRGTAGAMDAIKNHSILYQNSPNPFQDNTIIRFKLADEAINASICIFDMQGKMLKNFNVTKGEESVSLSGYELGKGLYLYSLIVNGQEIDTKKMIII